MIPAMVLILNPTYLAPIEPHLCGSYFTLIWIGLMAGAKYSVAEVWECWQRWHSASNLNESGWAMAGSCKHRPWMGRNATICLCQWIDGTFLGGQGKKNWSRKGMGKSGSGGNGKCWILTTSSLFPSQIYATIISGIISRRPKGIPSAYGYKKKLFIPCAPLGCCLP